MIETEVSCHAHHVLKQATMIPNSTLYHSLLLVHNLVWRVLCKDRVKLPCAQPESAGVTEVVLLPTHLRLIYGSDCAYNIINQLIENFI